MRAKTIKITARKPERLNNNGGRRRKKDFYLGVEIAA